MSMFSFLLRYYGLLGHEYVFHSYYVITLLRLYSVMIMFLFLLRYYVITALLGHEYVFHSYYVITALLGHEYVFHSYYHDQINV